MAKVILVVLDGLRFDTAVSQLGYMYHLVEQSKAALFKVKSELPSLSRPLYEVILTGTPSWKNGITSNREVRLSRQKSIFHLAREHQRTTAAAAYYWVSELYNRAPFNYIEDREQHHPRLPIQHGKFYFEDHYPDSHLFLDAESLRRMYDPDFLYIHSMNIDDAGHKHTSESREYRDAALKVDSILAQLLPIWIGERYHILVTADHGMNAFANHGGTGEAERDVALFAISPLFRPGVYTDEYVPQLAVAPLVCNLLGIPPSPEMKTFTIPGFQPHPGWEYTTS